MSDNQRVMQLREQVNELQRALRAAQEENNLLTYERDELVRALKSWASHQETQADHYPLGDHRTIYHPSVSPNRTQAPRKSRQRLRA